MNEIGAVCTPMMIAAHKGDMEAVVMLLEANADVTIKSSEGKTAADFAADRGHDSIAEILSVIVLSQQKAGQERPPASDVSAAESSFSSLNVDGGSAAAGDQAQPPPPSSSSVTSDHTAPASTTFSLEALQARAADTAGCDKTRLHEYLSHADFQKTFGMSLADFAKLPGWKQDDAKKKHRLF